MENVEVINIKQKANTATVVERNIGEY